MKEPFRISLDKRWKFSLFVIFLGTFFTIIFTYPLIRQWTTHVPGFFDADAINHTWAMWWFEKSIFTLKQSPANLNYIYFPVGAYHPKVIASIWAKLTALPWIHFLNVNPFIIYNIHLFLSSVLTFLFTTWFCLELTDNRTAAIFGAVVFTFCISRTMHILTGHFTQILTYTYPLFALSLWRLYHNPSLKNGLIMGLVLGMASIIDLMPLAYFIGPLIVFILLYFLLRDRRKFFSKSRIINLGTGFFIAALITVPFYLPLLRSASQGELEWYQVLGVLDFSADALALFIPPPTHPLAQIWGSLGRLSQEIHYFGISYTEGTIYAGWVTLILGVIGLVKFWEKKQDIILWTSMAFSTALLALGPLLRFKARLVEFNGTNVVLPYAILTFLPLLSWGRTPGRFNLLTMFALAILVAYGVSWLYEKLQKPTWRNLSMTGLLLLIILDSQVLLPFPMIDIRPPSIYHEIALDNRAVAVLDLPVIDYAAAKYHLLYQMEHGHALVGGYRDRRPPEAEKAMLALAALAQPGGDPASLAEAGIGYVVLHKNFLEPLELKDTASYLTAELGSPMYDDATVVIYTVPNPLEIAPRPLSGKP